MNTITVRDMFEREGRLAARHERPAHVGRCARCCTAIFTFAPERTTRVLCLDCRQSRTKRRAVVFAVVFGLLLLVVSVTYRIAHGMPLL